VIVARAITHRRRRTRPGHRSVTVTVCVAALTNSETEMFCRTSADSKTSCQLTSITPEEMTVASLKASRRSSPYSWAATESSAHPAALSAANASPYLMSDDLDGDHVAGQGLPAGADVALGGELKAGLDAAHRVVELLQPLDALGVELEPVDPRGDAFGVAQPVGVHLPDRAGDLEPKRLVGREAILLLVLKAEALELWP
jgi:hypothetical protein